MTKKDYIKLAQALKDSKPIHKIMAYADNSAFYQWQNVVETIAMTLQHDNPRFNRSRFLHACGYNE